MNNELQFHSNELNSATEIAPSITYIKPEIIDVHSLKNDIKILILTKDKNLLKAYDYSLLTGIKNNSGNECIKTIISILKDYIGQKYKEDTIKNLTIRKNFDIIALAIDCLTINGIDMSSDEVNSLILGFLSKNFI